MFIEEEINIQRDSITNPRSHDRVVAELRFASKFVRSQSTRSGDPDFGTVITVLGHVQGKGSFVVKVRVTAPGSALHESGGMEASRDPRGISGQAKWVGAHSKLPYTFKCPALHTGHLVCDG